MTLPLPYKITDPADFEGIQANFDEIAKQFPISRRGIKIETPNLVGAPGQPTFANGWTNYDTNGWTPLRFWKDSSGMVTIEGLVRDGTANSVIFVLPEGYRPGRGLLFSQDSTTGHARVDVAPTGEVKQASGGQGSLSVNLSFRQEQ